jgi:hypothetical protein
MMRVQRFIQRHCSLPTVVTVGRLKADLDAAIERLYTLDREAEEASDTLRLVSQRKRAAEKELREYHVMPALELGRVMALSNGRAPEAPRVRVWGSNVSLVASANRVRAWAEKNRKALERWGYRPDGVKELDGAIAALEELLKQREDAVRRRTWTVRAIAVEVRKGGQSVRLIDVLLRGTLRRRPELVAKWKDAKLLRAGNVGDSDSRDTDSSATPSAA